MLDLLTEQRGYTPPVAKRQLSKIAHEPVWRTRIAAAVAPHGRLKAIAEAAGMESPQLQKIANGTTQDPGVATLARIAVAMGWTLEQLVSESRPGKVPGSGNERPNEGSAVLEQLLGQLDAEAEAEDSARGDILRAQHALQQAEAALNRALRRSDPKSGAA